MDLVLHTDRLTLTPFDASDVDIAIALSTDPEVRKYAGHVMQEHEVRREMPQWTRRGADGSIGIWCVRDRDSGKKLGTGALLPMPVEESTTDYDLVVPGRMPENDIEIGFFLKPSAWGQGYATETCMRLLQFAFEETPLTEVVATHHVENKASRRVLEKSGFTDCGTRRCYGTDGPDLRISREEWFDRA